MLFTYVIPAHLTISTERPVRVSQHTSEEKRGETGLTGQLGFCHASL